MMPGVRFQPAAPVLIVVLACACSVDTSGQGTAAAQDDSIVGNGPDDVTGFPFGDPTAGGDRPSPQSGSANARPDSSVDYLDGLAFAADWWNDKGGGERSCRGGKLFFPSAALTPAKDLPMPVAQSTVHRLDFPHADAPSWKTAKDSPAGTDKDFCGHLSTTRMLPAGTYRFLAQKDDGLRIFIDGKVAFDFWDYENGIDPMWRDVTFVVPTTSLKRIDVYYIDRGGDAVLKVKMLGAS